VTVAARPALHFAPTVVRDAPTIAAFRDARRDGAPLSPRVRIAVDSGQVIILAFRVQVTVEDPVAGDSEVGEEGKGKQKGGSAEEHYCGSGGISAGVRRQVAGGCIKRRLFGA